LATSALDRIQSACSASWVNIATCRAAAAQERAKIGEHLRRLVPADTGAVVFGSLARDEWTPGSDVDWTLLVDGPADQAHLTAAQTIKKTLVGAGYNEPGPTDIFGSTTFSHHLVHRIGGDHDSNRNTTQRILLLVESAPIGGESLVRERVIRQLFKRYIEDDHSYRPARPWEPYVPRFFLNDVVRYWRTMAVDFAAKLREREGEGWALRNFKLRVSRKLLFCAGLTMSLSCKLMPSAGLQRQFESEDEFRSAMAQHLVRFVDMSPLEILAEFANHFSAQSAARRIFGAYDEFLGILLDSDKRLILKKLTVEAAASDALFEQSRSIATEYQKGLTELFFGTSEVLTSAAQEFGVF
jgi:predicted nucleotidyltransferase